MRIASTYSTSISFAGTLLDLPFTKVTPKKPAEGMLPPAVVYQPQGERLKQGGVLMDKDVFHFNLFCRESK